MRKTLLLGFGLAVSAGLILIIDNLLLPAPSLSFGWVLAAAAVASAIVFDLRSLAEAGWQTMALHLLRGRAWCLRLAEDLAMTMKRHRQPTVRRHSGYGPVLA